MYSSNFAEVSSSSNTHPAAEYTVVRVLERFPTCAVASGHSQSPGAGGGRYMTKKMNSSQSLLDAIASLRSHILCHKLKTVMYSRLSYCQGCQTVNRICNTPLYLSSCRVHEYSSTFLCVSCTQRILVVTILFPFSTSRSLQVEHVSSKCT